MVHNLNLPGYVKIQPSGDLSDVIEKVEVCDRWILPSGQATAIDLESER